MDDSSSGGEGPAPVERLREPLLKQGSPEAVDVEVWEFSREWAEFDDSSGEEHGRAVPSRFRQEAARSPNWPNGPASPGALVAANGGERAELEVLCFGSRVRGALVCCFYFVENNLLAVCAALAFWERDCVALACLGPPWSLLVLFEIWLASNDRSVTATVQKLRRQGAYLRLAVVHAFVVVVLGCFFGYLLFRARRHWIQKGQRSFVAELEGLGTTPQVDATRLDTLVMFLTSVPAVVGLSCSLADSYGTHEPLAVKVFAVFLAMCTADLAIAITEFDYSVSRHIRQRYDMYFDGEDWFQSSRRDALRFQKLHCCSRLAELLGRMLVLMAGAIASTAYPGLAAAAAGADFLFGVSVLACVSGLSGKVVLIGVPVFLVDIAHYVDEPGFAPSAQKLSRLCAQLHACEIAVAIAVYVGCGTGKFPEWRAAPWGPCLPAAMGCATVVFYSAHFVLRWLVAAPAFPGELFGSPGGPPTQFQDLQALFGQEIGIGSVPRKRRRLVSFLFWGGFGEQLEHLREQLDAHSRGSQVRLSNLKNLGTLGAGGFGKVFKVKDAVSGNVYALKLQLKDKAAKCAIREAQALHRSEHAFIVRLVHVFQTKELYGILMEFCATDLNRHILACTSESDGSAPGKAEGLPEAKAERYTICMLLALEHLHGKGIVFRDLKPENVLLTAPEEGDYAKLTDFGLAKPLERALPGNGDSSPIFISPGAGTPAFMAREAFQKVQSLDAAVTGAAEEESGLPKWVASRDWYALGCCLLLMLLGEHGGRRASAGGREVLLPPPASDIPAALRMAARRRRISAEAFHLVASLTAPEISERAGAAEVRQCGWLAGSAQLLELEAVAADEAPRSRVGT